MGEALMLLSKTVKANMRMGTEDQKGDWKPLLFIMTDGSPSDIALFREAVPVIKAINFGAIIACAAGPKSKDQFLQEITHNVVHLDTADSLTLKSFFKWVSDTIENGNKSVGVTEELTLPTPPSEVHLVI